MDYTEKHRNSGFKVRDKVKVIRKCKNYEEGWINNWCDEMDSFIGNNFVIVEDNYEYGFALVSDSETFKTDVLYDFPYFVLEKIEQKVECCFEYKNNCPRCQNKLENKISEYTGETILKCFSCGWC